MTIPRVVALQRYWRAHPPAHVLVAAFMGYRAPPEADGKSVVSDEALGALLAMGRGA